MSQNMLFHVFVGISWTGAKGISVGRIFYPPTYKKNTTLMGYEYGFLGGWSKNIFCILASTAAESIFRPPPKNHTHIPSKESKLM